MPDSHESPSERAPLDASPSCPGAAHDGTGSGCRRCLDGTSDLDVLLSSPGFRGSVLRQDVDEVTAALPLLNQIVGVTAAGPAIMNDVGIHDAPVDMGGPIRCAPDRITLRVNRSRLGAAVVTEPTAHVPPILRLFDAEGGTSHATYLTEQSDRLAFEALSLGVGNDPVVDAHRGGDRPAGGASADFPAPDHHASGLLDQIGLLDSILADGGAARRAALAAHPDHGTRVEAGPVIDALRHAALLGMPVTLCATAPGCIQMHHDVLDGAREHRGSMVIASGTARVLLDFTRIAECWVTRAQGVWGSTGAIELYDHRGRAAFVATQTGPVARAASEGWDQLIDDLADAA